MNKNEIEKLIRGGAIKCESCGKTEMMVMDEVNFTHYENESEIELWVYCENCGNDDTIKGTIKEIEWK